MSIFTAVDIQLVGYTVGIFNYFPTSPTAHHRLSDDMGVTLV